MASDLLPLSCHPEMSPGPVRRIAAAAQRQSDGTLELRFVAAGELGRVLVPALAEPRLAHLLWQHTCFEAFVAAAGDPAYHELNFAPSREWVVYAFRDYRDFADLGDESTAPQIVVESTAERLTLTARIDLARLRPVYADTELEIGLAAVIEDDQGAISYWSLFHPEGPADFHARTAFALRLEAA